MGAYGDDQVALNAGAAYVFERVSGESPLAVLRAKLTASDPMIGDDFGRNVSISGDTIVVGATGYDDGGVETTGGVYLFVEAEGGWSRTRRAGESRHTGTRRYVAPENRATSPSKL